MPRCSMDAALSDVLWGELTCALKDAVYEVECPNTVFTVVDRLMGIVSGSMEQDVNTGVVYFQRVKYALYCTSLALLYVVRQLDAQSGLVDTSQTHSRLVFATKYIRRDLIERRAVGLT